MPNKTLEKWEEKTLDEVCTFSRGLTYSKNDEVEVSNNVVLRANNIDLISNTLNFEELKYINNCILIPEDKKVKENSIMMCISSGSKSHLGKVAFIDKNYGYAFGGFMGLIIPKENIIPKFLYYMLITPAFKDRILHLTDGANINNLKYSDLKDFRLNIPLLPEQQRIVGILDEAFENIEKAKQNTLQNLNNAKELSNTRLNMLINSLSKEYGTSKLKDITTKLGDGLHGTPKFNNNGNVYFINGNNLSNGKIVIKKDTKLTTDEELKKYRKELNSRTILVSINGTVGNVAFYNNEKIILGKSACYFNLKENISKEYIKQLIQSNYFLTYVSKNATEMTIKNVSLEAMRDFPVPMPPLSEQEEVSNQLDELQEQTKKLEQIYTQKLQDLDELKQSILQKAFNGEL